MNFDGSILTIAILCCSISTANAASDLVIADFESETYGDWKATGDAFGPCHIEPHHPDLYWYGIHTMEVLYTIMGTGCQTVTRIHTEDTDFAVGVWDDGRIGTFRGIRKGASPYGALVYGDKGVLRSGTYAGYEPLVKEIITFFKTGKAPVPAEETIEIYAFMSAADISKTQNGKAISIPELIQKTKQKINQ